MYWRAAELRVTRPDGADELDDDQLGAAAAGLVEAIED